MLGTSVKAALDGSERSGAFLLRSDIVLAIAAVDQATVATALLYARGEALARYLGHAVRLELFERPPQVGQGPGPVLGALLVASVMAGNDFPSDLAGGPIEAAVDAEFESWPHNSRFLRLPDDGLTESTQPPGVFASRPKLTHLFFATVYLRRCCSEDNATVRDGLRRLLRDERLAGATAKLRQLQAVSAHLFGPAGPHLFDDPRGSMMPAITPPEDMLGVEQWMLDERLCLERVGTQHACLWLGRMLSAEASAILGWPPTRATTELPPGMAASARSYLVRACGENARRRALPTLLREEGSQAWARRRLVASCAHYFALRNYDGIDVLRGPTTGMLPPPPPPPEVRWFVEPVPEVFDALADAYDELDFCTTALGGSSRLIASSSTLRVLADCARATADERDLDQAQVALVRGFVEYARNGGALPSDWLQLTQRGFVRCGALRAVEAPIVWRGEVVPATTCEWSVESRFGSTPLAQALDVAWSAVAGNQR